jgi:hypothetical protein
MMTRAQLNRKAWVVGLVVVTGLAVWLRVASTNDLWNWFDKEFPDTWRGTRMTLSQDESNYVMYSLPDVAQATEVIPWKTWPYYRPPLPSHFFAWLFPQLNYSRRLVAAVETVLAVLTILTVVWTVKRLWGRRQALCTGLILATHPVLCFYDPSFEDSTLTALFLSIALALYLLFLSNAKRLVLVAAGAAMGLAILSRPNALIVFACVCIQLLWHRRRNAPFKTLAVFAAPVLLAMLGPVIHNYRASKQVTVVVSTIGENLYWGNNSHPSYRTDLQGFIHLKGWDTTCPTQVLAEQMQRVFPHEDRDSTMRDAALAYVSAHPGAAIWGLLKKAARHFSTYETPRNRNFSFFQQVSWVYRLPVVPYALLAGFALVAFLALSKWRLQTTVLLFPFVCVLFTEVIFFNASRYRALAIPFLVPLAVRGASYLIASMRPFRWRLVSACAAVPVGLLIIGTMIRDPEEEKAYLAAAVYKTAFMEVWTDDPAKLVFDEGRFLSRLREARAMNPANLEAFHLEQTYRILKGDHAAARVSIDAHRATCQPSDVLCMSVCNALSASLEASTHQGNPFPNTAEPF